jgi:heme exporter protein C
MRPRPLVVGLLVVSLGMMAVGAWLGLVWSPPEAFMGDVARLMYVHVPAVWMALLAVTVNFFCSVYYLVFRASWKADAMAEASASVGLLFGTIGVALGSIWGRATWGVWWTWDARLTTAAILLVVYGGYVALRRFVEDPERRGRWAAVLGILAFADVPILWFSVKIFRTTHQTFSSSMTVDSPMTFSLRFNAFAFLAVLILFVWARYRIAARSLREELAVPEANPAVPGQKVPA